MSSPADIFRKGKRLQNLLRYINDSKDENVTDDNTDKLNNIVRHTKNKPGMEPGYMKKGLDEIINFQSEKR